MSRRKIKILRSIAVTIVTIAALLVILPDVTAPEHTVDVKASPTEVYQLIESPENWTLWYAPFIDENATLTRQTGPESGKGATLKWKKTNEDFGEIRIRRADEEVLTAVVLHNEQSLIFKFQITQNQDSTTRIQAHSRLKFPESNFFDFLRKLFDRSDDYALQDDLARLAAAAETPSLRPLRVVEETQKAFTAVCITDSCQLEIQELTIAQAYRELLSLMTAEPNLNTLRPIIFYPKISSDSVFFRLALPISNKVETANSRAQIIDFPEQNCAIIDFYGPHTQLGIAHNKIQQWMQLNDKKLAGEPSEQYLNDILSERDSSKLLTRIAYPFR